MSYLCIRRVELEHVNGFVDTGSCDYIRQVRSLNPRYKREMRKKLHEKNPQLPLRVGHCVNPQRFKR